MISTMHVQEDGDGDDRFECPGPDNPWRDDDPDPWADDEAEGDRWDDDLGGLHVYFYTDTGYQGMGSGLGFPFMLMPPNDLICLNHEGELVNWLLERSISRKF